MKKKSYFNNEHYKNQIPKNDSEIQKFGLDSNFKWMNDPRQYFISLARYKFVSKILKGRKDVLEVGCADGFNSRLVKQSVKNLTISDAEFIFKMYNDKIKSKKWKTNFVINDFVKSKLKKKFDAIYSLDVLEHIPKKKENIFIKNINHSLKKNGILIIGAPSLEFQKYSRPKKISGHINCKTEVGLRTFLNNFFFNVVTFSMNDELVHTGFEKMSCYNFAICTCKK
jgi:2-polyprenyl-3-methyl-5-hydroxy-6-metoxy-1,4-benzoquinol methylase